MTKVAQVWTSEDICGDQGSGTFIEHLLWTRHALDIYFLLILRGKRHICCFITQMRNGGSERVSRSSKSAQVVRYWDSTPGMTKTAHLTPQASTSYCKAQARDKSLPNSRGWICVVQEDSCPPATVTTIPRHTERSGS